MQETDDIEPKRKLILSWQRKRLQAEPRGELGRIEVNNSLTPNRFYGIIFKKSLNRDFAFREQSRK